MGSHVDDPADDAEGDEAVEDADADGLKALDRVHTDLDPDGFSTERLRIELRARAEDDGPSTAADMINDEAATDGGHEDTNE